MRIIAVALIALSLGGCKLFGGSMPDISIGTDNYCQLAKRRTWSVNDTQETIDQIRRDNARYDRICGAKQPA